MSSVFLGMPTAPRGVGRLRGDDPFPVAARRALADAQLRRNLHRATATIRAKRARVVAELPDWEELREAGRAIKADALANLDRYLEQLEEQVTARGGTVHWARDANEANEIVTRLVRATGASEVVKVKSIVTDEIGLNDALAGAGIQAIETDLAELIVQLGKDRPSHILVPAIRRNRAEIRDIFLREMPGVDPNLTDDPPALAEAARLYLRRKFLSARVGVSGANFAVAQTGTLCVVESEGNGRMCLTLPDTLITVMGIEKVVPSWEDLGVFLQLLPRSATGERMNPYTSMWTGVHPGDGPQEFHLILLDNGRTRALADEPVLTVVATGGRAPSALDPSRPAWPTSMRPIASTNGRPAIWRASRAPCRSMAMAPMSALPSVAMSFLRFAGAMCGGSSMRFRRRPQLRSRWRRSRASAPSMPSRPTSAASRLRNVTVCGCRAASRSSMR